MRADASDVRTAAQPSAFWPAVWLAVALILAKAAHWGLPSPPGYSVGQWLLDWALSAYQDVLFALGFGVLGQALLALASRRSRARTWVFRALVAAGAFCAFYAVIAKGVFDFLRSPLTYPLLYLAGGMKDMRSSIGGVGSWATFAALALAPLGYLLAVRLTHGRRLTPAGRLGRAVRAAGVLLLALCLIWAHRTASGRWSDRGDALIVRNPHWAFLASLADLALARETPSMEVAFPPEDLADFAPTTGAPSPLPTAFPGVKPPRNVIIVLLESNAARYTSLYGGKYDTTPMLARESAHAAVFDAHYTPVGLTANVLVAMHLSIYPYMTWREYTLEYPDFPGVTLAEILGRRGYRTLFVHTGHLSYTNQSGFLAHRGYDQVLDWDNMNAGPEVSSWGMADRILVDQLLSWIDRDRTRPFLGVAWTINSHHPYEPLPGQTMIDFFKGELPPDDYDLGRYLNTLHETDREMGRLFDGLRQRGLADDTLVIVAGDHGQGFGWPHPTWGHGFRVYDENVRVPFMIWNPRLFPAGRRMSEVTSHVDINPTVTHLLGLPPDPSWEGWSVFAAHRPPRAYFYAANDAYLLGVREGTWKYVLNATRGSEELFDLARDPDEQANVAARDPARALELRQHLSAWKTHVAADLARARATLARTGTP